MKIAIDGSRAFLPQRTGIEEYSYQVIKHLRLALANHRVVIYVYPNSRKNIDFQLPASWKVKEIKLKRFWTQLGLSWEMLTTQYDALFVPAHTLPFIHPANSYVTVHGLEYEHNPQSYSFFSRIFHRFFIKRSSVWAKKVIAVSSNTKRELAKMYGIKRNKIIVVYNGFKIEKTEGKNKISQAVQALLEKPFCLFMGRLEERKNIINIVKAFDELKKKHHYQGNLILAGKPGFGYAEISQTIAQLENKESIKQLGYVSEEEKAALFKKADLFFFPSLSEGFGIPILEAQSESIPVVTSNYPPMSEVAGSKEILVNPRQPKAIGELAGKLIFEKDFRQREIKKGLKNIERFSWQKCAAGIAKVILG